MERDNLYWKAFWTFFCGLGMVFWFTLLPFVIWLTVPRKFFDIQLLGFVGVAVLMLAIAAALISFLLVQTEGSDTNEALRVARLQRLTNVGRICILFGNLASLTVVLLIWGLQFIAALVAVGQLIRNTQNPPEEGEATAD